MSPPARRVTAGVSHADPAPVSRLSFSWRTWTVLGFAFLVLTLLLGLTTVTLISQRQRTVLLNKQLGTLVGEASFALRDAEPVLDAQPTRSSTVKSRADAVAALVTQARPLVGGLNTSGLPQVVAAAGQLLSGLQQDNRLIGSLDDLATLAATANRARVVDGLTQLFTRLPAASALIGLLNRLGGAVQSYRLIPRAATGLDGIGTLIGLTRQSLRVQKATLATSRSTRDLTQQTLSAAQTTLATAQQILTIAQQTLAHAASLDRKVGPVP